MGLSNKKTTTTQNTTQNTTNNASQTGSSTSTSTPNNPSWVTDPIQSLIGQIGQLGGTNPQNYVAPASSLQQQAFGQAGSLANPSGMYDEAVRAIGTANSATTPLAQGTGFKAASLLDNLDAYVNPELNNVVRTSLEGYDQDAAAQRAQYAADGARNKAFGGSRYALGESALLGDLTRDRAMMEAGLRSNAYDKAFGYSNLDAGRRQEADRFGAETQFQANLANQDSQNRVIDRYLTSAGLLSGLGSTSDASNRANIGLLADLGGDQRAISQSEATAPISLLQVQQALLSGLPLSMFTGQTTSGTSAGTSTGTSTSTGTGTTVENKTPSLLQGIGQGADTIGALAALFSDRRLKRDIKQLGTRPDGLGVYEYAYVWGPERHVGVMADEVLKVKPEAVLTHPSGYLMVDYGRL